MITKRLKAFVARYFLLLLAVVAGSALVWAVDGDPPGLFEVEGDAVEGTGGDPMGDDWDLLHSGGPLDSPAGSFLTWTQVIPDPGTTTAYWKGPSKDINDIDKWWHRPDSSVPDKNDITNAYAAAYLSPDEACIIVGTDDATGELASKVDDPDCDMAVPSPSEGVTYSREIIRAEDDLIVYYGFDRYANDGDAFGGFWFFQNKVCANESTNRFDDCNGGPVVHKKKTAQGPGDVLLLVEWPQANDAPPVIKAYEWDPDDFDGDGNNDSDGHSLGDLDQIFSSEDDLLTPAVCDGTNFKEACAITNDGPVPLAWDYTPKDGSYKVAPADSFYEGGVNLTQILGDTLCVSTFLAESRASRSESAILKDFVLGDFNVCGADIRTEIHAGSDHDTNYDGSSIDIGATIHDAAFVSIVGPPGAEDPTGTVTFYRFDNAECSYTGSGDTPPEPPPESNKIGTYNLPGTPEANGEYLVESSGSVLGAGPFSYLAVYSGDANYNAATAPCETITVNQLIPTIGTVIHAGSDHSTNYDGSSVMVGTSIHDKATVGGSGPTPTGTVTFTLYDGDSCSGTVINTYSNLALVSGAVETSSITTVVPGGSSVSSRDYSYLAQYSGDSVYKPKTAVCETVQVDKYDSTVTTDIHAGSVTAAGHSTADIKGGSVDVGTVVHDIAKVTGAGPKPTGTVSFKFYPNNSCTNEVVANGSTGNLATGNEAADITGGRKVGSANFDTSGYITSGNFKWLSYKASYGGDANYNPATDSICETLKVVKRLPTIATTVRVVDVATVTGDGSVTPTGNVSITVYSGTGCTGTGTSLGTFSIASAQTAAQVINTLGATTSISFKATYLGDSNYVSVTHGCENVTVQLPAAKTGTLSP